MKKPAESDSSIHKTISARKKMSLSSRTAKHRGLTLEPGQGSWILGAAREDLIAILDNIPVGLAVLGSPFGGVLFLNRQMPRVLGYSLTDVPSTRDMLRKAIPSRKTRSEINRHWKEAVKAGGGSSVYPYICGDGKVRFFETRSAVLRKDLLINMWTDVTRREEAEVRLKESELTFRSLFEHSTEPFLLLDGSIVVNCNNAVLKMLSCGSKDQIVGRTLESLSPQGGPRGMFSSRKVRSLMKSACARGSCRTEWRVSTCDGNEIPVELSMTSIVLEGKGLLFTVMKDVTPWKEAQNVLLHAKTELEDAVKERTSELVAINQELKTSREELRHLSEYLQRAREYERNRIAREVHDHVGQFLTGLKMNLVYQAQNPPEDSGVLVEQTKLMVDQIDRAIHSVQEICSELRPTMLGHFGLMEAIRWYLGDFQKRTGIKCSASVDSGIPSLHEDLNILLFRIFQEAMTNILRHARATRVAVKLKCEGNTLLLKIRDNGRGILKEEVMHPRSFGIVGIRERVRFWGGKSEFKGSPNRGTTVTVWLPMSPDPSVLEATEGTARRGKRGSRDTSSRGR